MFNAQTITYDQGNFQGIDPVRQYASTRYERWLDYSKYQCSQAGIEDESVDVLNEVIVSLFEKEQEKLEELYSKKNGKYTELDFFILRMIKLNCYSETAPYRAKFKPIPVDREVRWQRLAIIDETDESIDTAAVVLKQMRLVRWVFQGLDLTPYEKSVFEFRFFEDRSLNSEWPGSEYKKDLYDTYYNVLVAINEVLFYNGYTNFRLIDKKNKKLTKRQEELADRFIKTHKVSQKTKHSLQLN